MSYDKEARRRWDNSPAAKIRKARYDEAHAQERRERQMRYYYRKRIPVVKQCAAIGCSATFVVGKNQGRKKFCADCAAFYRNDHKPRDVAA